ncbi:hypothetical protein AGMMS49975_17460 [Clostridia bacterium]|nr:hypothetical protein AGMMS49975_17460 [Clostridia bacterium]
MDKIFGYNGYVYRFGNALWEIIVFSFLWTIFSIPIVTCGAATTALYYVATRRISDRGGYIFRDFLKSFKDNFKQATKIWCVILVAAVILCADVYLLIYTDVMGISLGMKQLLLGIQIFFLFEVAANTLYIFPVMARFDMDTKTVIKTSAFMAHRHLHITISLLLMFAVLFFGVIFLRNWLLVFITLFWSGLFAFGASYLFMHVFKIYRPEMDKPDDDITGGKDGRFK